MFVLKVWGTVKASYQGSFAQYITVPSSDVSQHKSIIDVDIAFVIINCDS